MCKIFIKYYLSLILILITLKTSFNLNWTKDKPNFHFMWHFNSIISIFSVSVSETETAFVPADQHSSSIIIP